MSVVGTVNGPSGTIALRRTLRSQSPGDGWGQVRLGDLRESWNGDDVALLRAVEALEWEEEIELVAIGDVVSVQPA